MWNPEGNPIQVIIGLDVLKIATQPDQRTILDKWFDVKPPQPGEILVKGHEIFRKKLQEHYGINLPDADFCYDQILPRNHVLIYFGIERRQFQVTSLNDIANYIFKKAREYAGIQDNRDSLRSILQDALESPNALNNPYLLDRCCKVYFISALANYDFETVISLGYAGNFILQCLDLQDAVSFLLRAFQLCLNTNSIDSVTQTAMAIDAAIALRIKRDYDINQKNKEGVIYCHSLAIQCFKKAIKLSQINNDRPRLFLALCGLGGLYYLNGDLDGAESLIENALEVTTNNEICSDLKDVLLHIARLKLAKERELNQKLKMLLKETQEELEKYRFTRQVKHVALAFLFHATTALIYAGAGILGKTIKIQNSTLNGPLQIGMKNIQKFIL
jgi:tetratricopeptide (TPR) repeat protein